MANFMNSLSRTMNEEFNYAMTENGALAYRTTGKALLDLNFAVASLRSASPVDIANRFEKAFFEDKVIAMKWLFYARDIRGGLGERRLFRTVFGNMASTNPEYVAPLIRLVPEYGRWDDLWCLLDTKLAKNVLEVIAEQLRADILGMEKGESISLLAKWLPTAKSSNASTRKYIIDYAMSLDIPYLAFNFPIDTCLKCGYQGEIDYNCPKCGNTEIQRLRRVTGYLTTDYRNFNAGKIKECLDRVKHSRYTTFTDDLEAAG